MVIAFLGTFSIPKKSEAASVIVTISRYINLVVDEIDDPGSLKPMWPVFPIPKI
jgi:hypothetical protein